MQPPGFSRALLLTGSLVLSMGCASGGSGGGAPGGADGGVDARHGADAGVGHDAEDAARDSRVAEDAVARQDAGAEDAVAQDAPGTPEAGAPDAPADARAEASSPRDAGRHDAPATDARPRDAASDHSDAPTAPDTCADGAPVAYSRLSCPGTVPGAPTGLGAALTSASIGDVVSLGGLDEGSLPCFPVRVCVATAAPTLLFSDDPESPSSDGVLYADELSAGGFRAYVYHTNAGGGERSFPVVLLNQGTTTVHATVTAEGLAGPSQDYVNVGKQALSRWFASRSGSPLATVDVPPGTRVVLSSNLAALQAATNDLVHGIIDFTLDGPVKLSVVSVLPSEDPTVVTGSRSLLPGDGHGRGTFPGAALEVESTAPVDGAGVRHLRFGGDVTDVSLAGHDYVDGTSVTLDGNYGVSYAVRVAFASGVASGLLLSPQGGGWGGVAAAGPTLLPTSEDAVSSQSQGIALGAFGAGTTASVTFVSAGGSSLPVDLVTVPTE